jgi:hypothetical protein
VTISAAVAQLQPIETMVGHTSPTALTLLHELARVERPRCGMYRRGCYIKQIASQPKVQDLRRCGKRSPRGQCTRP